MAEHAAGHHEGELTGDLATDSEGSVVLVFCAALLVALAGFAMGFARPGATEAEHGAVPSHGAVQPWVARGARAAVATAAPEASQAALEVLKEGGNAFDALVTASFVVSVVRPQSTGIGGGGFVVYHDAATGEQDALDGRERAPGRATPTMYQRGDGMLDPGYTLGPRAAGVPGLVALLQDIYATKGSGKVSWSRLVAPAVRYARDGFEVPAPLAAAIARHRETLASYPDSARVFLPQGRAPRTGDVLRQTDLAETLEAIARDDVRPSAGARQTSSFYRGPIANELARAVQERGGLITAKDLAEYEVVERTVVRGEYRGLQVVSMPPPSSGGVHLVQMLNILSGYDLAALGPDSPKALHLLTESMRRAYADRDEFMADSDFVDVPVKRLIDRDYAARQRAGIDPAQASASRAIRAGRGLPERPHTTHISIVDEGGNAVASTQTINTSLGSCFVAGRTGVLLNNEMNDFTADPDKPNAFGLTQGPQNLPEPGKRPLSSMTPTIVLDGQGRVRAVLGSPGGPKIITTVLQVLINLVDHRMHAERAVAAPRIHHQWEPDELVLERPLEQAAAALARMGHPISVLSREAALGNAQVVEVLPSGERVAVSDPRGTGRPAAY